jgi:hypothetical protein
MKLGLTQNPCLTPQELSLVEGSYRILETHGGSGGNITVLDLFASARQTPKLDTRGCDSIGPCLAGPEVTRRSPLTRAGHEVIRILRSHLGRGGSSQECCPRTKIKQLVLGMAWRQRGYGFRRIRVGKQQGLIAARAPQASLCLVRGRSGSIERATRS